jgi:ribose 5-phosphate isomerase RpiB
MEFAQRALQVALGIEHHSQSQVIVIVGGTGIGMAAQL